MRARHTTLAATLLLALALASCSGDAPQAATPEATSTSAPPAIATPTPVAIVTPEATPTPEQACANGMAVANPEANPVLAADCVALLSSMDALRGEASLDWGGGLAIGDWDGVAVSGEPPRVTGLDLRDKGLTGTIPAELGNLTGLEVLYLSRNRLTGTIPRLGPKLHHLELRGNRLGGPLPEWLGEAAKMRLLILHNNDFTGSIPRGIGRLPRLQHVTLSRNALTGCVPSAFEDIRSDADRLGLPWCLRYDNLDATGTVATAGSWAVLDSGGGGGEGAAAPAVLTTWEGLRSGAATLRVHETDAGGTSWASEFGAVAVNDLFEWRKADDCWVRYRVTGAPAAPPNSPGRWEFPIEWMTYAATGAGCTGAVGSGAVLRVDEAALDVIPAVAITSPVRHGAYLIYPRNWTGTAEPETTYEPPAPAAGSTGASETSDVAVPDQYFYTRDPGEARRRISYWRDPALPADWTLVSAESENTRDYCASFRNELGYEGIRFCVYYRLRGPIDFDATQNGGAVVYEPRMIDGRAAVVKYSPQGPDHRRLLSVAVYLFDSDSGIAYVLRAADRNMRGSNIEPVISIAHSLLTPGGAP